MLHRTRREQVDFLSLVFSVPLDPAPYFNSPEAVSAAAGVDVELVRQLDACGLLRSEPSGPGRGFDADDVRVVAITSEMLDLGTSMKEVEAFGEVVEQYHRAFENRTGTPYHLIGDALRTILQSLAERARDAADRRRLNRITRAISSIDALVDLV